MHLLSPDGRSRSFLGVFLVLALGLATSPLLAQQSLRISDESTSGLQMQTVDVLLIADSPTEGFVLSVSYPTADITVSDLTVDGTVTGDVGAELVVAEIFDATGGFTLGIVLDATPPFDGQTIDASVDEQVIAQFNVTPDFAVDAETTVAITFEDGLNTPALDNILVQGGFSVGIGADLDAIDGTFTIMTSPPDELFIGEGSAIGSGPAETPVLMTNLSGDVQAFVLSIEHDAGLTLDEINIDGTDTEDAGAEFVVATLHPTGGTLAVVLDVDEPNDGQVIAVGDDHVIANYVYSCDNPPVDPAPAATFELRFVDLAFGEPLLENVLVVAGQSVFPTISDTGLVTCNPGEAPPEENTTFSCGMVDADGNLIDPTGSAGEITTISLFFSDPDDNIQGFQIAMCFDDILTPLEGSFTVEDTILDALGAEFVNTSFDTDLADGDGVELTAAILLDALPPFDNQMTPVTEIPLEMARFDVLVGDDAECDSSYELRFCNGINGAESRDLDNLVVIDYQSRVGIGIGSCDITVVPGTRFVRGDCNNDGRCDLADPATALGAQFQGVIVPCEDACDANDDGKADLADAIYLLTFLFKSGPDPFAPFPRAGLDPTEDELTCDNGMATCPE